MHMSTPGSRGMTSKPLAAPQRNHFESRARARAPTVTMRRMEDAGPQEIDRKGSNSSRGAESKSTEHREREGQRYMTNFEEELEAIRVEPPSEDEDEEDEAGSGQYSEGNRSDREHREYSRDEEVSLDDALSGFGDISLADAFNIAASTTEENRLQPRRSRPPLPTQVRARRAWNEDLEARVREWEIVAKVRKPVPLLPYLLSPEPVTPGKDFRWLIDRLNGVRCAKPEELQAEESVEYDEDEDEDEGSQGSSPEGSFLAHGRQAGLL